MKVNRMPTSLKSCTGKIGKYSYRCYTPNIEQVNFNIVNIIISLRTSYDWVKFDNNFTDRVIIKIDDMAKIDLSKEDIAFILDLYDMWKSAKDDRSPTLMSSEIGYGGMTFQEFITSTGNAERVKEMQRKVDEPSRAPTE